MAKKKQKFDLVTQGPEAAFTDVGKSETAGRKYEGVSLPDEGGTDGNEGRFVYCKQCGFLIDTTEVTEGNGWGNATSTFKDKSTDTADADLADTTATTNYPTFADDPVGGCPHCHSSNWR